MANGYNPQGYRRGQPSGIGGGMPSAYDESGDLVGELGELDQMSQLIQMLQNNPQYAQLFQMAMGGFDPMVQQQLEGAPALQQQILGGGYFGGAEEQTFRDLVSGETLRGQGGTLYDMIQEQYAPAREEARGYAASRGLRPGTGSAMSYEGQVAGDQQRAFAEQMVNKYLQMVQSGTLGLGQMGTEQLARQQSAGNIGQWLSQFVEGAQQGRMGIGLGITQAQQQPLMQLLQMHAGRRDQMRQQDNPLLQGLSQAAPFMMDAMFPGAGAGLGAGLSAIWQLGGGGAQAPSGFDYFQQA